MAEKINQAEKLARTLQSDNSEFRRHLGTQEDWARHLIHQRGVGFNLDGSYEE